MLKVKKLNRYAFIPTQGHPGEDLGYDLYALSDTTLEAGKVTKVDTGIAVEMLNHGFEIRDRSSMAMKGLISVAGIVDLGYRDSVKVCLLNTNSEPYYVKRGDKIAQLLPRKIQESLTICQVDELSPSNRGLHAFGSTGR